MTEEKTTTRRWTNQISPSFFINLTLIPCFGHFQYLMDKGEEMINHEYDQLVDKDHFEHCHHCRHKRHSVSFLSNIVNLQVCDGKTFTSSLEIDP